MRRRDFLLNGSGALCMGATLPALAGQETAGQPTRFQIGCMTLPYSSVPVGRALEGIQKAGYRYVGWGVNHRESGGSRRMLAEDAAPTEAAKLAARCRDMGLTPVMMFATVQLEAPNALDVHLRRIDQAAAA